MPACVIAFSILCVPWAEASVRVFASSFGESAAIETAHGDVSVEHWSDEMAAGGWDAAARLCRPDPAGERCIAYRRQDDGPQTLFLIRRAGCDLGRRILVTSRSAAGRDRLLAAFSVIPPGGSRDDAVPLADLAERRNVTALPRVPSPGLDCTD